MNVLKIFALPHSRDMEMNRDAERMGVSGILDKKSKVIKVAGVVYKYIVPSELVTTLYDGGVSKCYYMDKFGNVPKRIKEKMERRLSPENIFTTLY